MKKIIKRLTAVLTLVTVILTSVLSNAANVDENNGIHGAGNPVGSATAGKASYSANAQMWKISVYVAKEDTVTNSNEYSLSEDYHKFGYTFWLYRDGYGVDHAVENGCTEDLLYLELGNKEEYYHGNAAFMQAKYSAVKDRVFRGSSYGLTGKNTVPLVHNFPVGNDSSDEIKAFFDGNKAVSNQLVFLAAKAAGSTPEKLLSGLVFTINGETKTNWPLNMVDIRVDAENSEDEHTSCVSWVFMYEPVVIINSSNITGYYHGVTATGIAAAMKQGVYNFTSSESQFKQRFKSSENRPADVPVPWGLGTTFPMYNFPNALYLAEPWLGYDTGKSWQGWNGTETWFVESQLAGGGFGLRYQRAEVPTVIIRKTVNEKDTGTLSGFEFTVKSLKTGEEWKSVTTSSGKIVLYLPSGDYEIKENLRAGYEAPDVAKFTVPRDAVSSDVIEVLFNNTSLKTGSLHISKVVNDGDYSGISFTVSSERFKDFKVSPEAIKSETMTIYGKDGEISANVDLSVTKTVCGDGSTCRRINLKNIPVGTYTIVENCPSRYYKTLVGTNHVGQTQSSTFSTEVYPLTSTFVRYDNFVTPAKVTGSLTLTKRIKLEDIVFAHGTPTFFISVESAKGTVYTRSFVFTEKYVKEYLNKNPDALWVEMSVVLEDLPSGKWVAFEKEVMRYRLASDGIEVKNGRATVLEDRIGFTVSNSNCEISVAFTNEKYDQGATSHNDIAINEFII